MNVHLQWGLKAYVFPFRNQIFQLGHAAYVVTSQLESGECLAGHTRLPIALYGLPLFYGARKRHSSLQNALLFPSTIIRQVEYIFPCLFESKCTTAVRK